MRVLDVLMVFTWAPVLIWQAHQLGRRRQTPTGPLRTVAAGLGGAAVVYFVGALCDYGPCHFQAGGIGTRCNGMACVSVSCLCLVCTVVGHRNPRFLAFAVFTAQGIHRLPRNWTVARQGWVAAQ